MAQSFTFIQVIHYLDCSYQPVNDDMTEQQNRDGDEDFIAVDGKKLIYKEIYTSLDKQLAL